MEGGPGAGGCPRKAGHAAGAETFRTIATFAKELGLEYLTVYAFSTENWKRPQDEVDSIMGLLEKYLREAIETMAKDKVKMAILWRFNSTQSQTSGPMPGDRGNLQRVRWLSGERLL